MDTKWLQKLSFKKLATVACLKLTDTAVINNTKTRAQNAGRFFEEYKLKELNGKSVCGLQDFVSVY